MKLEKLSAIAELVSSAAIVVTLGYLAIQTQQNTTAIQASVRQAMLAEDRELLHLQISYPHLQEILLAKPGTLTDEDKIVVSAFLTSFVRSRENQWLQYQNGVIDQATWNSYRQPIRWVLSYEVTRPWWTARLSTGEFDEQFVANVRDFLSDVPISTPSVSENTGIP
jgi:hypothetical protein